MASFEVAFNWMMDNEDADRDYKTVPDTGGMAISGINSAAYPQDFARINAIQQQLRGQAVAAFYQQNFWNKWYAQLASDEVAKRVFDAAVNMGPGTAVKILQKAINEAWSDSHSVTALELAEDGHWGPQTVTALNSLNEALILGWFKTERLDHYQAIVEANPADAKYLGTEAQPGPWWTRCMK